MSIKCLQATAGIGIGAPVLDGHIKMDPVIMYRLLILAVEIMPA